MKPDVATAERRALVAEAAEADVQRFGSGDRWKARPRR